jgi:hypothetical protein
MTPALFQTPALTRSASRKVGRSLAIAFGVLALACSGAQAQSHGGFHGGGYHGGGYHGGGYHGGGYRGGYYRGGGWGVGPFWGLGIGLGLGLAGAYYYDTPDYVVVDQPPPLYYGTPPAYPAQVPPPAPAAAPDPIFYPRNGQNATQVEADRQACNRWATTQPRAMSDASIFQRATFACMDGRGYTAR